MWKNHFSAGQASLPKSFPIANWCFLTNQCNYTINMLQPCRQNPLLSAFKAMEGSFLFDATPIVPPGTEVLIHLKLQFHPPLLLLSITLLQLKPFSKKHTASSKNATPHPLPILSISLAPLMTISQATFSNIVISSSQTNTAQSGKHFANKLGCLFQGIHNIKGQTPASSSIAISYLNTSVQHTDALSVIIDCKKRSHIAHDSPWVATALHMMATRALQQPIS
jgi:hypothetical protein